ncbi:uncharacterized protein LOC133791741 [Humulus lupulus]|uniref:uncharacterized protein LOC133791741 n=1 Tax=Humulus lupulus TaxID=3486 RepID=UPI002B40F210|nr:uncharacterized protein LOC133791741 [Humulus lupulus]
MSVTGSNYEQPQFIASAGNRSFSSNAPLIENSDAQNVVPDGFSKESLNDHILNQRFQLKPEALNALKLPVKAEAGFLGSVKLKRFLNEPYYSLWHNIIKRKFVSFNNNGWDTGVAVQATDLSLWKLTSCYENFNSIVPWSRLGQDPIVVHLDRIFLLVEPATHVQGSTEDAIQEAKKSRVREMEMKLVEKAQQLKSEVIVLSILCLGKEIYIDTASHVFVGFASTANQNKFFGDQPAIDVLTKKQNALLGVATNDDRKQLEEDARYPPWVQCCLKSHYLDKSDIWGSQQYRIFGTRLVVIRIDTHCLVCWLEIV